jgi:hypothetical protein
LNEANEFLVRLRDLIASGESEALESLVFDVSMRVVEDGAFSQEYLNIIFTVLDDPAFLRLKDSWKLLRVFEYNWEDLSDSQRSALLPKLEKAYGLFDDWMACFVISGILGEQYGDDRAFDVLCRLKSRAPEMQRSMVPHGFEHIVTRTSNHALANRALAELTGMQRDKSEAVRREVTESLSRLVKRKS